MLKKVTITGADDSIRPEELVDISKRFPFVEWAILVSRSSVGTRRFPSMEWIEQLANLNTTLIVAGEPSMKFSCHLCGSFVRDLLKGYGTFLEEELDNVINIFDRVQINTHGEPHAYHESMIQVFADYPSIEWIFQYDNVNVRPLEEAVKAGQKCSALFDLSHGTGVEPTSWPEPLENILCGYAGGISPDNIEGHIEKILKVTGEQDFWIDMETHVRSDNDKQFDLSKVVQCLEKSERFVNK